MGTQQRVGLPCACGPGRLAAGVDPGPDRGRSDLGQRVPAEQRQEVQPQQVAVQLTGAWSKTSVRQPVLGVGGQRDRAEAGVHPGTAVEVPVLVRQEPVRLSLRGESGRCVPGPAVRPWVAGPVAARGEPGDVAEASSAHNDRNQSMRPVSGRPAEFTLMPCAGLLEELTAPNPYRDGPARPCRHAP